MSSYLHSTVCYILLYSLFKAYSIAMNPFVLNEKQNSDPKSGAEKLSRIDPLNDSHILLQIKSPSPIPLVLI